MINQPMKIITIKNKPTKKRPTPHRKKRQDKMIQSMSKRQKRQTTMTMTDMKMD